VLRGDPPALARLADVARRLDARAGEGGAIRVLWLDHADAALLVPVLERLVGGAGGEASAGSAAPVSLGREWRCLCGPSQFPSQFCCKPGGRHYRRPGQRADPA
jgi:hypothetical protein